MNNYNQDGVLNKDNSWLGHINYETSNDPNVFKDDLRSFMSRLTVCDTHQQKPIKKALNFRQASERYGRFDASQ